MIAFADALARLLARAKPLGSEIVSLDEARGRVLAEDVVAKVALPPFDYSAMDGYAVRASDLDDARELRVVGESAAGGEPGDLEPRTAMRIFTGARLPSGADSVVMQEEVTREGDVAKFSTRAREGQHVRRRGADLREGALALEEGARLTPGRLALAAALDRPTLSVAKRPRVTILATGDELRAPGALGKEGTIAESNATFVAAACRDAGAAAVAAPYVRDEIGEATRAVERALAASDVVITIGGVSVGDRDVMKEALANAGVGLDFWKVKIKPGKPLAVGAREDVHVLGLPGNPASASLTFLLFGVPLLRALQGDRRSVPERVRMKVDGHVEREGGREEFLRATIDRAANVARIHDNQASGAVTSFAEADALVVVPADRKLVARGDELEIILLDSI